MKRKKDMYVLFEGRRVKTTQIPVNDARLNIVTIRYDVTCMTCRDIVSQTELSNFFFTSSCCQSQL